MSKRKHDSFELLKKQLDGLNSGLRLVKLSGGAHPRRDDAYSELSAFLGIIYFKPWIIVSVFLCMAYVFLRLGDFHSDCLAKVWAGGTAIAITSSIACWHIIGGDAAMSSEQEATQNGNRGFGSSAVSGKGPRGLLATLVMATFFGGPLYCLLDRANISLSTKGSIADSHMEIKKDPAPENETLGELGAFIQLP